jgi:hypothetical protein
VNRNKFIKYVSTSDSPLRCTMYALVLINENNRCLAFMCGNVDEALNRDLGFLLTQNYECVFNHSLPHVKHMLSTQLIEYREVYSRELSELMPLIKTHKLLDIPWIDSTGQLLI